MNPEENKKEPVEIEWIPADPFQLQAKAKKLAEQKEYEKKLESQSTDLDKRAYNFANRLFDKLVEVYGSPYFSSQDERFQAVEILKEELLKGDVHPNLFVLRMRKLANKSEFKTKPHIPIINRFWEMESIMSPKVQFFDINKNL